MRRIAYLLAGTSFAMAMPALAQDETPPPPPAPEATADTGDQEIVVTARKREESLQDVPVAVTAITGEVIERRGLTSVRDVAAYTPSLSINSDGTGRAFVAIRGVGVTLIDSVQPGVGIFLDGIYQPNTSYLNNPLIDVERVEVLRGPQATLYGKNTLGGAINVITRQPGNELEGRVIASYAGPDNAWFAAGSISGPIIEDRLQARLGFGHREQDGFIRNTTIDIDAAALNTDTLTATVRAEPIDDVVLTVNGSYDWVRGNAVPYAFVTGPRDYNRETVLNTTNYQFFEYKRLNARLELPITGIDSTLTLIGAYDERDVRTPAGDLDFSALDIARNSGTDELITRTAEARLDSDLSSTLSSIVGLFYSRETRDTDTTTSLLPPFFPIVINNQAINSTENETWAVFGNLFWRPSDDWELSAGLRYDEQRRRAEGAIFLNGVGGPIPGARLSQDELSPRIAVTRHWNRDLMSYASVARGFRGGGFNPPQAPFRTYQGDSVWTYEVGTKYASADNRLSLAGAVFYNDYNDYIGLNSIAPAVTGGFTTVDLNTGDVESYGIELEGVVRPTEAWTISAGLSLQHARLTDTTIYTQLTGRTLSSDRLTFQPDWNFSVTSDYVVPVGPGELVFLVEAIGKGSRLAATLNQTTPTILDEYILINGSISYRIGGFELQAFVTNAFQEEYFESYIEKTTLILAGLTPSDVGIIGDRRRVGVRARFAF